MIFNFPMQDEQLLIRDLEILKTLEVDQVTFYPLMAGRKVRRELAKLGRIRFSREKRLYDRIWNELTADYRPSSAWCFSRRKPISGARPQPVSTAGIDDPLIDEYIVASEEYAGLGSGSFGYLRGTIYANTFSIPAYIESLSRGRLPVLAARRFSLSEQLRYDFLMKMFGGSLDLGHLDKKYGASVKRKLWKELLFFRLNRAVERRPGPPRVIRLSRRGYYFLVILMREFFAGVNNFREACLAGDTAGKSAGRRDPAVNPEGKKSVVRPV
jgi:hypothetical protein